MSEDPGPSVVLPAEAQGLGPGDRPSQRSQEEFLPLSALQHVIFCERQFALIHVERVWIENTLTVEGRQLHTQVDQRRGDTRVDVHTARGVPLKSERLALVGRADVVEFWHDDTGAEVPGLRGRWRPYPVEYKRGKAKRHRADEVQLCAQAVCLEEMLEVRVLTGALFYGRTRRRLEVVFDDELRGVVARAAARIHALMDGNHTPTARHERKCDSCSLQGVCRPDSGARSARRYMDRTVQKLLSEELEEP